MTIFFQMDLFRLVVYYNGEDIPATEIEEWHGWRNFAPESPSQKWQQVSLLHYRFIRDLLEII